jgi:hypothetical protein
VVNQPGMSLGPAVRAFGDIALDDRLETGFAEMPLEQPVQSGGVAADRGRRHNAARTENAAPSAKARTLSARSVRW